MRAKTSLLKRGLVALIAAGVALVALLGTSVSTATATRPPHTRIVASPAPPVFTPSDLTWT